MWVTRGMAWPAVGVVGRDEASMASQPATGGRRTRQDRRWFGRLEHEDQRLKKHYSRWMDIHYCRMAQTRHYDWRPFDETVCDAIIANGGVKILSKKVQNICDDGCIKHGIDFR